MFSRKDLGAQRLADIEQGVSERRRFDHEVELVWPLVELGGIAVPLASRTGDGAIRDLVGLADAAGLVCDKANLVKEVRQRVAERQWHHTSRCRTHGTRCLTISPRASYAWG